MTHNDTSETFLHIYIYSYTSHTHHVYIYMIILDHRTLFIKGSWEAIFRVTDDFYL